MFITKRVGLLLGRLSLCYGVGVGVSPGFVELGVGVILGVVLGVGLGSTDVSRITTLILVVGVIPSRVKVNVSLPSVILSSTAVIRRAP